MAEEKYVGETVPAGHGEPWEVAEMPKPPEWNMANFMKIVGPGAVILSMAIGSGEWLMGPSVTVRYGVALMWIVTIGIITQVIFNMESIRYTLYTGEPIMVGLARQAPGPKLWVPVWSILSFLSVGPGWVIGAATALAALFISRMPGDADRTLVLITGLVLMIIVLFVLSIGGKVEQTLETVSKWIVGFIFLTMLILNIAFVPFSAWIEVFLGFFKFGFIPAGKVDWFLLGGLAGYAGAGGMLNLAISNWMRDKGFGMGGVVGYIPSAIGGKEIAVSKVGKVFKITEDGLSRWRGWWRYALWDQLLLFGGGAFVGMYLCVLLAYGLIAPGTEVGGGWGAAAYQAEAVAKYLGNFGWFLMLFIGMWVLWGTQLSASDAFVRQMTDLYWMHVPAVRNWSKNSIRKIYYSVLIAFTIWLAYIFTKGMPLFLVAFTANIASVCFVVAGIQLLFMDRFYPKEIRGSWLSKLGLIVMVVFYGIFAFIALGTKFFGLQM